MKTFIYYSTLIILAAFLQDCTVANTTKRVKSADKIYLEDELKIYKIILEEHDYYYIYGYNIIIHSDNCKKCNVEYNN